MLTDDEYQTILDHDGVRGLVDAAKAEARSGVAMRVAGDLLAGMTRNNAYEYDGKPIYDGLTKWHLDETLASYKPEATQ